MIINEPPELIPKRIREEYNNFTQIGKSSSKSNYLSFRATSKLDDKPYTIRVLNIEGDLYKNKKNLSVKLYLQELFYLSARFGKTQADIEPVEEMLLFDHFEVGDGGSMAFVMKDSIPLGELMQGKADEKAAWIEDFVRKVYDDLLFINSRFGISNIDINLDSICCFDASSAGLSQSQGREYFITNWNSGSYIQKPFELMLKDSSVSILEETAMKIDELFSEIETEATKITNLEQSVTNRGSFTSEELKSITSQANSTPEVYCLGLLALELAGVPRNRWMDLVRIENQKNYAFILDSIVQSLTGDYGQPSSLCEIITEILQRDPQEKSKKAKDKSIVSSKIKIHTELEKEYNSQLLLEKEKFKKFLTELQVQLLTILEKLYGDKIPQFELKDPEKSIHSALRLILQKVFSESQPTHKRKLHTEVKDLLDSFHPDDVKQIFLPSLSITDYDAITIGKNTKWTNLSGLYLHNNQISDRGIIELTENQPLTNLEILDLRGNYITSEGAAKIGSNQSWVSLQQLWLYQNRIRDEGAIAIAGNKVWKKLECLDLSRNFISDEGAAALGGNVTWQMLKVLQLFENEIGNRGAIALASNKVWKNLKELDLEKNKIGYEGVKALTTNTTWTCLERCLLSGNLIEEKEAASILQNDKLKEIGELVLDYEQIPLGFTCNLCEKPLEESDPQCYNYQKKIYYCYDCVKGEEYSLLGNIFGMKKYIDPHALIFIDVTDTAGLKRVLKKRINDQIQPEDLKTTEDAEYHELSCDVCLAAIGKKIRWKCLSCKNIDLCDKCYLLSRKRDMSVMVALITKGHDVESHILQRYVFIEKN